ncbi:hypothetical protein QAD02_012391 [Eretmocerus hayati]|uniref:Uncharacterized protein n=1 Tax=Eretmocerus hayati TaxID=131215 RepID=A0ACC2NZS2_9HYME|nr:hypothetical protein QAD02_012391 [Eretmocerus hayati]
MNDKSHKRRLRQALTKKFAKKSRQSNYGNSVPVSEVVKKIDDGGFAESFCENSREIPSTSVHQKTPINIPQCSKTGEPEEQIIPPPRNRKIGDEPINTSLNSDSFENDDGSDESYNDETSFKFNQSDSSDENQKTEDDLQFIIADILREWALDCNVVHAHLDPLLKKLKPFFPKLPVCHKTLLKKNSERLFPVKKFNEGDESDDPEFLYIGIKNSLQMTVKPHLHALKVLKLQFNFDGLSPYKASPKELWIGQGKIFTEDDSIIYDPFTIQVWWGEGKPKSPALFLQDFVKDLNELLKNGVVIDGELFQVEIHCFICDRPARAFIKVIISHSGFFCCERCYVAGSKPRNTSIYPSGDYPARTDEAFRLKVDAYHHHDTSPLIEIESLNMILHFVSEFMHLGPLGITKKLLQSWTTSDSGWKGVKLSKQDIDLISERMKHLSNLVPSEFQRSTRSLGIFPKWNATEYRFFQLYCAMFVLKSILPKNLYMHFMLFSVASRILSSDELISKYLPQAEVYMNNCSRLFPTLYGEDSQALNPHTLSHVADDVKNLKCNLSRLSAFPFENKLSWVKQQLNCGYKPMEQLSFKIEHYLKSNQGPKISTNEVFYSKKKLKDGKVLVDRVTYNHSTLSLNLANSTVLMKNGDVVHILEMYATSKTSGEVFLRGEKLIIVGDAFTYPMNSSCLGIYEVKDQGTQGLYSLSDVKSKMVRVSIPESHYGPKQDYVVPLLH